MKRNKEIRLANNTVGRPNTLLPHLLYNYADDNINFFKIFFIFWFLLWCYKYLCVHNVAIGCPTMASPINGWLERSGNDVMIVGCNVTRERWYLRCDGRRWIGDVRNCSSTADGSEDDLVTDWTSPFGRFSQRHYRSGDWYVAASGLMNRTPLNLFIIF